MGKVQLLFIVFLSLILLSQCKPSTSNDQDPKVVCKLPEVRGHCRALLPRWRYDPNISKCKEFKFGGCDGNGNNFMSYKACMAVCKGI